MMKLRLAAAVMPIFALQAATVFAADRISVADLVRVARIGDPGSINYGDLYKSQNRSAALISPNRRSAAVVVRYGDPIAKVNVGSIYIFTVESISGAKPEPVASLSSATNNQPVGLLRWLSDNSTLIFAGNSGDGPPQVFRLDVLSKTVTQLSHEERLLWYNISMDGGRLLTRSAWPENRPEHDPECLRRGCRIAAEGIYKAERGLPDGSSPLSSYDLRTGEKVVIPPPETTNPGIEHCPRAPIGDISPDGHYALLICSLRAEHIPKWWSQYTSIKTLLGDFNKPEMSLYIAQAQHALGQLMKIDLQSGAISVLTDAPFSSTFGRAIWIEEGTRLVLAGAFLPLSQRERKSGSPDAGWGILEIDPQSGVTRVIASLAPEARIRDAQWDGEKRRLLIRTQGAEGLAATMVYKRQGGRWRRVDSADQPDQSPDAPASLADGTELKVEESFTDPPKLVAVNPRASRRSILLSPNEWLDQRLMGRSEIISWTIKDGRSWQGILTYPPDYVPTMRYPLLLQTHGVYPGVFSLNGTSRNYPGQALAAHGVLVLQVADHASNSTYHDTGAAEWPVIQSAYEGAIDHLAAQGIADRERVGITGWSRSGMYSAYTLTHSSYPFAAASFTSTGAFGYMWYLSMSASTQQEIDADYGGDSPLTQPGLASWLTMSPGFNFARARTPTLMWENNSILGLWDWYSAMKRLGVPVEYYILPDGAHELYSVEQQLATNELFVDWFRFWLRGERDESPIKNEQYARWEEMRGEFAKTQRTPRPPLYRWTATPLE